MSDTNPKTMSRKAPMTDIASSPPSPAQHPTGQTVDLDELRRLERTATPGPWAIWRDLDYQGFYTVGDEAGVVPDGAAESPGEANPTAHVYVEEDARFIAAARTAVPALLAALAEAQRERDELKAHGSPGVMHEVDKGFYELAVKERDYHRARADRLQRDYTTLRGVRDAYERQWDEARASVELMRPVVEAARAHARVMRLIAELQDGGISEPSRALLAAVDTYETQEGTDGPR